MRYFLKLLPVLLLLLTPLALLAQTTPTAMPGILPVTPAVPFAQPPTPQSIALPANDARASVCTAPGLDGFLPYVVRAGDSLDALLTGTRAVTPTQAASLNCIDASDALPVGTVIFLPQDALAVRALPASQTSNGPARISTFDASADAIQNDAPLTLTWEANGERVYLYACPTDAGAPCVRPNLARPVALEGSLDLNGFYRTGEARFRLEAVSGEDTMTRDVTVEITCAQPWLGDDGALPVCPEEPARTVSAVYQPFEHGAMIWFSDTAQIYVLTADSRLRVYQDSFIDGMPDPEATAPEGLLAPVRGFGRLWGTLGEAAGSLGWATAPEQGFELGAAGGGAHVLHHLCARDRWSRLRFYGNSWPHGWLLGAGSGGITTSTLLPAWLVSRWSRKQRSFSLRQTGDQSPVWITQLY